MISQLRDLLDGIESAIFQLLSWLILIPTALLHIITQPMQQPERIQAELNPDNSLPFDRGISPIYLFLLVGVIPIWGMEQGQVSISLSGPQKAVAHQSIDLLIDPTGLKGFAEKGVDLVLQHDGNEVWRDFKNESELQQPFEHSYTLDESESAYFVIQAEYEGHTLASNSHRVSIDVPDEGDTADKSANTASPSVKADISLEEFIQSQRFFWLSLLILLIPLLLSVIMVLHQKAPLSRSCLRPVFYVQCAYFSPWLLSLYAMIGAGQVLVHETELITVAVIVFAAFSLWLAVVEVRYIALALNIDLKHAIGIGLQYLFAILLGLMTLAYYNHDTPTHIYMRSVWVLLIAFLMLASLVAALRIFHHYFAPISLFFIRLGKAIWRGTWRFYGAYLYVLLFMGWMALIEFLTETVPDTELILYLLLAGLILVTVMAAMQNLFAKSWQGLRKLFARQELPDNPD